MLGEVTNEKTSHRDQHLDLIYSQENVLNNIIPHALWSSNENLRLALGPHADGVEGFASSIVATQLVGNLSQMSLLDNPTRTGPVTTTTTSSAQSSEVNSLQTTTPKTS